jgi:hypothetical protein
MSLSAEKLLMNEKYLVIKQPSLSLYDFNLLFWLQNFDVFVTDYMPQMIFKTSERFLAIFTFDFHTYVVKTFALMSFYQGFIKYFITKLALE